MTQIILPSSGSFPTTTSSVSMGIVNVIPGIVQGSMDSWGEAIGVVILTSDAITSTQNWKRVPVSISQRVERLERNPLRRESLKKARQRLSHFISESGITLTSIRLSKGMSQKNLAELIGSQQSYIARIERNETNMLNSTIAKLAHALEITENEVRDALNAGWKLSAKEHENE